MISNFIFVIFVAMSVLSKPCTHDGDKDLIDFLNPLVNPLKGLFFDGPGFISNAPTSKKNRNKLPSVKQLRYYMYYSAAAYFGYDYKNLTCEYCLKFRSDVDEHKVLNNNFHNTVALVALSKKRKEIVVAFRGTLNIWNVVLDLLTIALPQNSNLDKQIKVHQGFYVAAMSLYADVVRSASMFLKDNPGFKLVITGHSLGAAMARLTYFFLKENKQFPNVTYELYTYGEPRVGNKYFAEFMNKQPITTARVVNNRDYVAHVPPTSVLATPLLGDYYVHPQTEFWINGEKGQGYCSQTVYEDPRCSMSKGPLYNVIDHLFYFDTDLTTIPLTLLTSLPFNIFNPVNDLPASPKRIETSTCSKPNKN